MTQEKANKATEKIVAIILEEINGYTKTEAKELSREKEGSELWTRIEKVLSSKN